MPLNPSALLSSLSGFVQSALRSDESQTETYTSTIARNDDFIARSTPENNIQILSSGTLEVLSVFSLPCGVPITGALAWRPYHPSTLAIGSAGAVYLVTLEKGQQTGPPERLDLSLAASPLLHLGPPHHRSHVTRLAFSPDGLLLAAALASPGFHLIDLTFRSTTFLSADPRPLSLLSFSPVGSHLVSASRGSASLTLWETADWTTASWEGDGELRGACWSGDGSALLLHFDRSPQVQYLQLQGPRLDAQLLTLPLRELADRGTLFDSPGPSREGIADAGKVIAGLELTPDGRLEVELGEGHPRRGGGRKAAVYLLDTAPTLTVAAFEGFRDLD